METGCSAYLGPDPASFLGGWNEEVAGEVSRSQITPLKGKRVPLTPSVSGYPAQSPNGTELADTHTNPNEQDGRKASKTFLDLCNPKQQGRNIMAKILSEREIQWATEEQNKSNAQSDAREG